MKKIILSIILTFLLTSTFVPVYAAVEGGNTGPSGVEGGNVEPKTTPKASPIGKLQNPLNANSVEEVILLAVNIMIYIGVSFAILAIIFVGLKFVLAQGNPEKIKEAQRWFFYIIIGLAILISARVIVEIVQNTLIKSGVVNEGAFRAR